MGVMPEIDYAFLADAAETQPGHKFHVLGGGITRIGGRTFPLRHPHLALVVGLLVTAPETEREHELRIVLLDPDGKEVTGATGALVARGTSDGRDAILTFSIDLWNLTFPSAGDYSFRLLVNGSERKRLPLVIVGPSRGRRTVGGPNDGGEAPGGGPEAGTWGSGPGPRESGPGGGTPGSDTRGTE
jgi:hypothetical protein